MGNSAATGRAAYNASSVADLARFFPDAMPLRLPVQLTRIVADNEVAGLSESTIIEFGDQLRVRNSDGSLDEPASVVAVQYQPGKTLVAARFKRDVPNWIVKS
jgi:hypothetical protein